MPGFVAGLGVQAVIVGGMGAGASNRLRSLGISVFGGASGSAAQALQAFAAGTLSQGATGCSGHDGHGCSGHHHEHG
jgi:predicted Fe-Mo cluster-binding NifX family protein